MPQNEIRGSTQIKDGTISYVKNESTVFSSGGDIFTDKEDHSSECTGTKQDFLLVTASFPGSEHVFWRGTLRRQCNTAYPTPPTNGGEYWLVTTTGPNTTTIWMVVAPDAGDDFVISYRKKF